MKSSALSLRRKRPAISELLATLILIAITLIAGAAVFGFVNDQAGTSENQYATSAAANINYLNEHFVIVNVQFPSSCLSGTTYSCALISLYNTGSAGLIIKSITAAGASSSIPGLSLDAVATQTGTTDYGTSVPTGCTTSQFTYTYATTTVVGGITSTVVSTDTTTTAVAIPTSIVPPAVFTVSLPQGSGCPLFSSGSSYQFEVLGLYGNSVSYQITASG